MRLATVAFGLSGIVATTTLVFLASFRSFERGPQPLRNRCSDRLLHLAGDDRSWFGTYELFTDIGRIEVLANGDYRQEPPSPGGEDFDGCGNCYLGWLDRQRRWREDHAGTWQRDGATVVFRPKGSPAFERELGLLDGEYVLLSEFSAWRRVPDARATSSSM